MSDFSRRIAGYAPAVRSVALATLMGATFLATPLTAAFADTATAAPPVQPSPSAHHTAIKQISTSKEETVDQRILALHKELKITADQETNWSGVATAMHENADAMQKLVAEKTAQAPESRTAVDDLKGYEAFAQAHVDGLKNLISSFTTLYASFPDAQKKLADQVFQNFGHKAHATHG
jgi:hypothetical protein